MSVVRSPTITITMGIECPTWMQKAYETAVKRDFKRVQERLLKLAERKGCTLVAPTDLSVRPESHRTL